jgi:acyl carrier protein
LEIYFKEKVRLFVLRDIIQILEDYFGEGSDDIKLNELEQFEFISLVQEKCGIIIPYNELADVKTSQDMADLVLRIKMPALA